MSNSILKDVATRTSGEVYIGVVGSVRSGKSTFIRKFIEKKVLPLVSDRYLYDKILDELPQSGEGKTIMTVEPKFVPSNIVKISIEENVSFQVRLVDCVGHIIESAKGYLNEDGSTRLVQTPWFSDAIPFDDAAKIGTDKVIESHSNIGIVMSSDGSFGEFTRDEYEKVEELVIEELKQLNKPFVLVINTTKPKAEETINLLNELENKYNVSVIAIDVVNMNEEDIDLILKTAMNEFDINELSFEVPSWVNKLDEEVSYKERFNEIVASTTGNFRKMKDVFKIQNTLKESNLFEQVNICDINSGTGEVKLELISSEECYNEVINELLGGNINDKCCFIEELQHLKKAKKAYDLVGNSLEKVEQVGYDIALPKIDTINLEKPELLKDGSRYGIKLTATAPMIQLVKINVNSTFEPIIGTKEQAEEVINNMLINYENDPDKLWNSEIFGRKLCDVINDGIKSKVNAIPDNILDKYKTSIEKVVNYGKGGLITIVL